MVEELARDDERRMRGGETDIERPRTFILIGTLFKPFNGPIGNPPVV